MSIILSFFFNDEIHAHLLISDFIFPSVEDYFLTFFSMPDFCFMRKNIIISCLTFSEVELNLDL